MRAIFHMFNTNNSYNTIYCNQDLTRIILTRIHLSSNLDQDSIHKGMRGPNAWITCATSSHNPQYNPLNLNCEYDGIAL